MRKQATLVIPEEEDRFKFKTPVAWIRLTRYEYWPFWILYLPSIIYGLWLALKARSLTYFTAANPGIELGGFFGESKYRILRNIKPEYLPKTILIEPGLTSDAIKQRIRDNGIEFPVICKPDKGERGFQVEKVDDDVALEKYFYRKKESVIIQEYIESGMELGVLYYRLPDGSKSGITSIVIKNFLSVTGDGVSTLAELIENSERGRVFREQINKNLRSDPQKIIPQGVNMILEPIGNHCRGTEFINGSHLITPQLIKVFDTITKTMEGFYFGRFDLKVPNASSLERGQGIRIFEVNGTTSEPAHIYDSSMNILSAQKEMLSATRLVYKIARMNHHNGISYTPWREAFKIVRNHFKERAANHD